MACHQPIWLLQIWILKIGFDFLIFFSTAQNWGKSAIGQRLFLNNKKFVLISRGENKLPYLQKYSNLEPIFNIQHSNFVITKSVDEMPRTWQNLWGIQALKQKLIKGGPVEERFYEKTSQYSKFEFPPPKKTPES